MDGVAGSDLYDPQGPDLEFLVVRLSHLPIIVFRHFKTGGAGWTLRTCRTGRARGACWTGCAGGTSRAGRTLSAGGARRAGCARRSSRTGTSNKGSYN